MSIRRSILLAAVAALTASPALAQDGVPIGDAAYGGSWSGGALGPAYGGGYGGSYGGSYGTGSGSWSESYDTGYGNDPAAYEEPDYYYEQDAGADYADNYVEPAYAPPPPTYDEQQYAPAPYPAPVAHGGGYAHPGPMAGPGYGPGYGPGPMHGPAQRVGYSDEQRRDWLRQCRARYGRDNDGGLGGALIGGAIGGIAGNRIAGKGNRTAGTIIGAGVGAIAGAAIDRGEDRARAKDECEDYLDRYEAYYAQGSGYGGYGYTGGYGQNVIWVPMVVGYDCKPKKTKVIEEWVEVKPARRVIYTKPAPTKLIKTKTIKQTKYAK